MLALLFSRAFCIGKAAAWLISPAKIMANNRENNVEFTLNSNYSFSIFLYLLVPFAGAANLDLQGTKEGLSDFIQCGHYINAVDP